MPEKTYKIGSDIYDIPDNEVGSFLKDNPNAIEVQSFLVGKDTFDIPLAETDGFIKDFPAAQPLKKKPSSQVLPPGGQTFGNPFERSSENILGPVPSKSESISTLGSGVDPAVSKIFSEYPGLKSFSKPEDYLVQDASGKMKDVLNKNKFGLEFQRKGETDYQVGNDKLKLDNPDKHRIYINSDMVKPEGREDAIKLDMLSHAFHENPEYQKFSKDLEGKLIEKYGKKTVEGNDGVDGYIRGYLSNSKEYEPYKKELAFLPQGYFNKLDNILKGGQQPPRAISVFNKKYGTNYKSVKEFTEKQPVEEPVGFWEASGRQFLGVTNSLFASAMSAPKTAERFLANPVLSAAGLNEEQKQQVFNFMDGQGSVTNLFDKIGKSWQVNAKAIEKPLEGKWDKNPNELFAKGETIEGFKQLGVGLSGIIPYMAAGALDPALSLPLFTSDAYNNIPADSKMTEAQKQTNAGIHGLIFTVGMPMAGAGLNKVFLPAAERLGVLGATKEVEKGMFAGMKEALKPYMILTAPVKEGLLFGSMRVGGNIADKYTDPDKSDIDPMEGFWQDFTTGIALTGGTAAFGRAYQGMSKLASRKKVEKLEQKVDEIDTDMANESVAPETKEILNQERVKTVTEINDEIEKHDTEIEPLPQESKEKLHELTHQLNVVESALQSENLSDASKESLESNVKGIKDEIKELESGKRFFQGSDFVESTGLQPGYYSEEEVITAREKKGGDQPSSTENDNQKVVKTETAKAIENTNGDQVSSITPKSGELETGKEPTGESKESMHKRIAEKMAVVPEEGSRDFTKEELESIGPKNISEFKEGDEIESIYSGKRYKVEKIKNGTAKLRNIEGNHVEDFNVNNNPHFVLSKPTLPERPDNPTGEERDQGQKDDIRRQKHDRLVDLTRQYNSLSPAKKQAKAGVQLNQRIHAVAGHLGYTVEDSQYWAKPTIVKNEKGAKISRTPVPEDVPEPSPEAIEHAKKLLASNNIDETLDIGMGPKEIRDAKEALRQGKMTKPVKRLIHGLEKALEDGGFYWTHSEAGETVRGFVSFEELSLPSTEEIKAARDQEQALADERDELDKQLTPEQKEELYYLFNYEETANDKTESTSDAGNKEGDKTSPSLSPESLQSAKDKALKEGFDHLTHKINFINSQGGTDYKNIQEIPQEVIDKAVQAKKLDNAKAKVDEIAAKVKKILKGNVPDDVKKAGVDQDKIIDAIADAVKILMDVGYSVKKAIDEVIGKFREQKVFEGYDEKEITDKVKEIIEGPTDTGIKNRVTKAEREARGLPEVEVEIKRSFPKAFEAGKKLVDDGTLDIRAAAQIWAQKPRPLSAEESVALIYDRMKLYNEHRDATDKIIESIDSGNEEAEVEARIRLNRIEEDILINDEAARRTGYEQGLGLAARKMMIKQDYSLAEIIRKATVASGKEIPDETRAQLEELSTKFQEAERKIEQYEKELKRKGSKKASEEDMGSVTVEVQKERKKRKPLTSAEALAKKRALIEQAKEILAKNRYKAEIPPEIIPESEGARRNPDLIPKELIPVLKDLQKVYVEDAINSNKKVVPEEMVEDIYDELGGSKENDFSQADLRDAISGYGKVAKPSEEELNVEIRKLNRELRDISALEFLDAGERPLKSGFQRDKLSAEERARAKEIRQKIREKGLELDRTQRTPEDQYASALDAVKTRLKNRIEDLTKQIAEGKKSPKKVGISYDQEATLLKAEADRLSEILESIEGKREMSDEQRIQVATAAVERQIAEYEKRIASLDFAKKETKKTPETPELKALRERRTSLKTELEKLKPESLINEQRIQDYKNRTQKRIDELNEKLRTGDFDNKPKKPITFDAEATRLKAESDRLKQKVDLEIEKIRLKNRSKLEKVLDYTVRWKRFAILSGVRVLGKLATAGMEQSLLFTPLRKTIQGGLSLLPGISKIAAKAPGEGFFSPKAIAVNYATWFKKETYAQAAKTLATGKSDIDVMYGKERVSQDDFTKFIMHAHAAIKALPKQAEYWSSLQQRAEHEIRNGNSLLDPVVQQKIHAEAYNDAVRNIFMNTNSATDLYRQVIARLNSFGDGGKILAALLKVDLPVVSVPTNIINDVSSYIAGGLKAAWTLRGGVDRLTERQADHVMRVLGKQAVGLLGLGLAYVLYKSFGGFYDPDREKKKKPGDLKEGEMKVGGFTISRNFLHHPGIYSLMMGSEIHRLQEEHAAKNAKLISQGKPGETFDVTDAILQTLKSIGSEVPFLEEPARLTKAIASPKSIKMFLGEQVKGLTEPQILQEITKYFDKNPVTGEDIKRKQEGFIDVLKMGIPGLRQQVKTSVEVVMDKRVERYNNPATEEDKKEKSREKKEKEFQLKKLSDELNVQYTFPDGFTPKSWNQSDWESYINHEFKRKEDAEKSKQDILYLKNLIAIATKITPEEIAFKDSIKRISNPDERYGELSRQIKDHTDKQKVITNWFAKGIITQKELLDMLNANKIKATGQAEDKYIDEIIEEQPPNK